jgi:hypothetical protein
MEENNIVKYEGSVIKRISNQIGVTNKLLALSEPQLIPYRKGDKWGFCMADRKIPFSFERANRFSCGLAKILVKENEYFIDKKGDIDSPIFDIMYGQNIVADLKSREKVKLMLMSKRNRLKALLTINDMRKRSVSAKDFIKDKAIAVIDGKPGVINIDGNFQITSWLHIERILFDGSDFIDSKGNVLTGLNEYDITGEFYEESLNVRSRKNSKWGFVDETGKNIISCKYDDVDYFFKGFAKVKFHGKYGFINKEGEEYWED